MAETEKRRVGDRGQVTLPKTLREEFGISGGDEVEIREEAGKIVIEKPISREDLAVGYRERADQLQEINNEMAGVSQEADEYLGEAPEFE